MKKTININEKKLEKIISEAIKHNISEILEKKPSKQEISQMKKPNRKKNRLLRIFYNPDAFIEMLSYDDNLRDALYKNGIEWAESIYPGDERVKEAAEKAYAEMKEWRESDEYKVKHKADLQRRNTRKMLKKLEPKVITNHDFPDGPFTPSFDQDMGWH